MFMAKGNSTVTMEVLDWVVPALHHAAVEARQLNTREMVRFTALF